MPKTTEAAVLYELKKPLRIVNLTLPELKPGQVLVEMAYVGVCHTQLLEARGLRGQDKFLPHALGHEGSGNVLEVGQGVTKVKPGDRVVLTWIKGTGAEVSGTTYQGPEGPVNSGAVGCFMRQTITCENRLVPIPDNMPLREAAPLGCAIPTGAGMVLNTLKLKKGESIAIFGVGGIGLSAVMAANMLGAGNIIAVDILDSKLEYAKTLGATHLINARQKDPVVAISEMTNGKGADYTIESAGVIETMQKAFQSIRNGGLCVLAGNLPYGEKITIDPYDLIKGKRIVGSWGGESQPDHDTPIYIKYYLNGKLNLGKLLTHTYCLTNINQALDDLENGKIGRALVNMSV